MKKGLTDSQKSVRPFLMDKLLDALANHLLPGNKISKYGFRKCYQSAIKTGICFSKSEHYQGFSALKYHFFLIPTQYLPGVWLLYPIARG